MGVVERIKALCADKKMSLQSLEAEAGLGINTIYKWDKASPSADKLKAVADYFGVSIDFLAGRTAVPSAPDEVEEMLEYLYKNPEMRTLLSVSPNLRKEDLEAVMVIIKSMNREAGFGDDE